MILPTKYTIKITKCTTQTIHISTLQIPYVITISKPYIRM